ncbi:hypothetical protein PBRA_001295 [Plasmodiophora brassicae]|nr:hypothetical protein PBRA_001295 [Plasmodiophora brassicae]
MSRSAVFLLLVTATTSTFLVVGLCWNPPRADARCGPQYGSAGCGPGQCCSQWGWCGASGSHCNSDSICSTPGFNWCGPVTSIALTFDDSAFAEPQITNLLDDLDRLGMKASFFVCPNCYPRRVVEYCSVLQRLLDAGHAIEDHTLNHPNLAGTGATDATVAAEVQGVPQWLQANCPGVPVPTLTMFRPPEGSLTSTQAKFINTLGYIVATWTIDSQDWAGIDLSQMKNVVASGYESLPFGSSAIIVHHDWYYTTPGSRGILDFYATYFAGYQFVTIGQCLAQCQTLGSCKAPTAALPGIYDS